MAAGDITKQLTEQVRNDLPDLTKKIIPTDAIIWRKLHFYQTEFMVVEHVQRVTREFDLSEGDTSVPIDTDILSVTKAYFERRADGTEPVQIPVKFTMTDADDLRKLYFIPETFAVPNGIIDNDVLYLDVFLKPRDGQEMNDTYDPVINKDYFPYLVKAVLSDYRDYNDGKLRPFSHHWPLEKVMKKVQDIRDKKLKLNKIGGLSIGRICNW